MPQVAVGLGVRNQRLLSPKWLSGNSRADPVLGYKVELSLGCAGREAVEQPTFLAAAEAPKRVPEVDTAKFAEDSAAHIAQTLLREQSFWVTC